MNIELKSTITCPECGHKKEEEMPTDACQFFYECDNCHTVLKPNQGDCCVYCSCFSHFDSKSSASLYL